MRTPVPMLLIMLCAAILALGAFVVLKQLESKAESADLVSIEEQEMMLAQSSDTTTDSESWACQYLTELAPRKRNLGTRLLRNH